MALSLVSSIRRLTGNLVETLQKTFAPESSSSSAQNEAQAVLDDLNQLHRTLRRVNAVLHDAEEREIRDQLVELWLSDLRAVAYEAEDALEEYHYELLRADLEEASCGNRKRKMVQDLDRLSNLPDSLLISIMSLLKVKEAVQTCILSKRWCYLWASVPSVHFDFNEFGGKEEKFNHFVSSFLNLRDETSNVHTFKLSYHKPMSTAVPLPVRNWISYACKHKVKNLEVDLTGNIDCSIPKCLFSCDSLELVRLNGISTIEANSVYLPKLRNLSLGCVQMSGDSMQKLLSGCPGLETLSLKGIRMDINRILFQNVKQLTLDCCFFDCNPSEATFSISAPCAKYVKFVRCRRWALRYTLMMHVNEGNGLDFNLLSGISGVETLDLSSYYLKVLLDQEIKKGTTLNNLKHLVLGFRCMCCGFSTLFSFLNHCPNLETLCLIHAFYSCEEYSNVVYDQSKNSRQIEACACQRLKMVKIVGCQIQQRCAHFLEKHVVEWTKDMDGVEMICT